MGKKAETDYWVTILVVLALATVSGCRKESEEQAPASPQAAVTPAETAQTIPPPGGFVIPDEPTFANAIVVSSQKDDLVAFEQKFKDVLGDTDLEAHAIGCVGCSELSSGSPPALTYTFVQEHPDIFNTFVQAWRDTQKDAKDALYNLSFNADFPGVVCTAPQHPQPCSVWYPCPDDCGRLVGSVYSCSAC